MNVPYIGDFAEDSTVYIAFNTLEWGDPRASCTITDLANTDIHIHKNNGLTPRNNAAGVTVSIDFDGITGNHMVVIDTNDDTVVGFWVKNADYFVRMEGTTIDGGTVNAWIGHFSIENRYPSPAVISDTVWDEDVSLAQHATANSAGLYMKQLWYSIVTRVAQCGDAGTATTIDLDSGASAVDDYYKGQLIAIILGTGIGQARAITAYNGTTKIATVGPAWATAPDGDSYFAVLNTGSSVVASGALTAGQFLALK